jgi:ABC-type branched-subunit amino acid transport system substrate-binding protein
MSAWDELSAVAHPSLVAGAITSQPWFMSMSTTESKAFLRGYQARYGAGKPVNSEGEAVYAAVHLYQAAVEKAGTTSAGDVAKALTEVEIRAPRGPLRVDGTTRVSTAPCIIGVNSGKGTIETHGDLGTSAPRLSGCPTPPR